MKLIIFLISNKNYNQILNAFSHTKSLKSTNSLPNNLKYKNISANDRQSICNLFADFFSSVYQSSDAMKLNSQKRANNFKVITISIDEVKRVLNKLDLYKVSSPDNIPAIFYKNLSAIISLPLQILYNKSLSEGKYPTLWKLSNMTPIFKSGNRSNVENYRPISILCTISKVFDRIIFNKLYEHVREHISSSQHGFVSGRSTQSNLLEYVNYIILLLLIVDK